jgi:tRNA pseudouridine55 synthase
MHGVFNILKPPGMTSHDVVALVRRATGIKRVGHTGTLDPLASGVMIVCVGQATRLVETLQSGTKEYSAEITFGYQTDTLDAEGEVVASGDASHIHLENLRAALDNFRGEIEQVPPIYSAIKQDGRKLYELARAGQSDVEIPTRQVTISKLIVSKFVAQSTLSAARAMLHIECSGGTYIRSLVRDIGQALNCPSTMSFLVRTRNGAFSIDEATTLEEIQAKPETAMTPMLEVLSWCADQVAVDDGRVQALAQGRIVSSVEHSVLTEYKADADAFKIRRTKVLQLGVSGNKVLFRSTDDKLAALAVASEDGYKADKVFHLDTD